VNSKQQERSRRAKPTSDDERLDVTAEVDRGGGVVDLVRQDGQLVVNPLSSDMAVSANKSTGSQTNLCSSCANLLPVL